MPKKCVLCLECDATTSEHFFKADIYRELFPDGKTLYTKLDGTKPVKINGSKADKLKASCFNLCGPCNNAHSQEADKVFTAVDRHLRNNLDSILTKKELRMEDVFGSETSMSAMHFLRYCSKHLACQLDRGGNRVPSVLRDIFFARGGFKNLDVNIAVGERTISAHFMHNGGISATMAGIQPVHVGNLSKVGILPENIYTTIQHCSVTYSIVLRVPEDEVVGSALSAFDRGLNEALAPFPRPVKVVLKTSVNWFLDWSIKRAVKVSKAKPALPCPANLSQTANVSGPVDTVTAKIKS